VVADAPVVSFTIMVSVELALTVAGAVYIPVWLIVPWPCTDHVSVGEATTVPVLSVTVAVYCCVAAGESVMPKGESEMRFPATTAVVVWLLPN
jgi:hypothetical protein